MSQKTRRIQRQKFLQSFLCGGILVNLFWLAACEPLQRPGRQTEPTAMAPASQAERLAADGRHDEAALVYLRQADNAEPEQQQRYLILAARERRRAGKLSGAQAILDGLSQPIFTANLSGWAIVSGELALAQGEPDAALAALERAPSSASGPAASELHRVRGQALFQLGKPAAATRAFLDREVWLEDAESIADNQQQLWAEYERWGSSIDPAKLETLDDLELKAWLELGLVAATAPTGRRHVRSGLMSWQTKYPNHPANALLIPRLLEDQGFTAEMPQQLALLLPLSGRQKQAGAALRDGFLAAHYDTPPNSPRPSLRIYDVDLLGGAAKAYGNAVMDGADFVVGPLLKSAVTEVAALDQRVPSMVLNYLPNDVVPSEPLYQFALAPEDEASEVATTALALDQRRAIALAPNNAWGRRLLTSFTDTFQSFGGTVIDYHFYDPQAADFSADIRDLLLISESSARHSRLAANLGLELGFEPRRRADIDLIFLAATDKAARLIRPQLKFYYAGKVPTYATSAIYQGDSSKNSDLNGLRFADMPWVIAPDPITQKLQSTIEDHWPAQAQRRSRLFAMGFDAYQLVPELASGQGFRDGELPGVTGKLYLGEDGRVHRRLPLATIRRGKIQALPPSPAQDLSQRAEELLPE